MKSALVLLPFVFICLLSFSNASHEESQEAKVRKGTATDTVKPKPGSAEKSASAEVTVTGAPSTNSPSGSPPTKPPRVHCDLTDALRNVSKTLSASDEDILEDLIDELELTILVDVTLTDIEKVVQCSYAIKHFCDEHYTIKQKLIYSQIGSWGLFFHFFYVSIDLQADIVEMTTTLDSNDNCALFDALLNATQGDSVKYSATLELVDEIKVVLLDVTLTVAQKHAKIHELFKVFFEAHPDWKSFFLSIHIEGFGSLESFDDVCKGFDQAMTLSEVISGSSDSDCVLCAALTDCVANTSFSLSERSQVKQFHDKLVAFFATTTDIQLRLTYISDQFYQLEVVEPWMVQVLFQVSLKVNGESWGIFYEILWVGQFCYNSGSCGCVSCGMNGPSTVAPTTHAPSTTRAPPNCAARPNLIAVTAQNTTILTDVLLQNYNTWNSSTQTGANSCLNKVRNAIWNNVQFPTPASKITEIVADFKAYNPNNLYKQQVIMNITIAQWSGYTILDFCNCGSG